MRLFFCTYDDPEDDHSGGANDTFVQAESPQQAFEIFVEDWRRDQLELLYLERYDDDDDDDDEGKADKIREAFKSPATDMPLNQDHIRVFEILLAPSRSQAGRMPWAHGLPATNAPVGAPGVVLIRGYWMR